MPGAVQVEWNLDVTRPGAPGRLTLYAGHAPPPERGLPAPTPAGPLRVPPRAAGRGRAGAAPVQELAWEHDGLYLRLTGQGPWELDELVALADSIV